MEIKRNYKAIIKSYREELPEKLIKIVDKIVINDLENVTIKILNFITNTQEIQKNPKFRTFKQWVKENNLEKIIEDEGKYAWYLDEWQTLFYDFEENWPWIFGGEYYGKTYKTAEHVILAFFDFYKSKIDQFLERSRFIFD